MTPRLNGWVKSVMAKTLHSVSRRGGSASTLVNSAYKSQTDSRTGLLQGTRLWGRLDCLVGVVLDRDTNATGNIREQLCDKEMQLNTSTRGGQALLLDRTRTADGPAHPRLELRGFETRPPVTASKQSEPVPICTG